MIDYKKIFAEHGYSLFESESLERAITDAIKEGNMRYLYGIPILLENSPVDYHLLLKLSKKSGVLKQLKEIFFISSKIIRNRNIAKKLAELSGGIKKTKINITEFSGAYKNHSLIQSHTVFPPSLNYKLSFLFAKKQIQILYKLNSGERLSKTEKEYFSRVIKKKLIAIRELYPLAKEILVND